MSEKLCASPSLQADFSFKLPAAQILIQNAQMFILYKMYYFILVWL